MDIKQTIKARKKDPQNAKALHSPKAIQIKQMNMDKVDFGVLKFGGDPVKNLKNEANLNTVVDREKLKQSNSKASLLSFSASGRSPKETISTPLRKHLPKINDDKMLTTIFSKLPPKNPQYS